MLFLVVGVVSRKYEPKNVLVLECMSIYIYIYIYIYSIMLKLITTLWSDKQMGWAKTYGGYGNHHNQ